MNERKLSRDNTTWLRRAEPRAERYKDAQLIDFSKKSALINTNGWKSCIVINKQNTSKVGAETTGKGFSQ